MKKSELIDKFLSDKELNNYFASLYQGEFGSCEKDLAFFNRVLEICEEVGMLPPESNYTRYCDCGHMEETEWEKE